MASQVTTSSPPDIGPASKASSVYDTLRHRILSGAYQPGERLRLSQIARELDVSEMPVREALRLLQQEGLVVIHLNRGAEVARLSLERGLEIIDARMTLEVAAAEASLRGHDPASIAALRRILLDMERARARPEQFATKNREFCRALFARCGNSFMRQLIEELWDQVWQASSIYVFELMADRVAQTMEENQAIVDALLQPDARRLKAVMQRRRRDTIAAWRRAVAKRASSSSDQAA